MKAREVIDPPLSSKAIFLGNWNMHMSFRTPDQGPTAYDLFRANSTETFKIVVLFLPRLVSSCITRMRQEIEKANRDPTFFFFFFYHHFHFPAQLVVLPSAIFWTSRGHRCRPFSPPARAFNFHRAEGSAFPLLVDFHRILLTHALALFANQFFLQEKVPTSMCTCLQYTI